MKSTPGADILGLGMLTSVGLSAPQTAASVRAGITRFRETPFTHVRSGAPIVMGLLADEYLPPLDPQLMDMWSCSEQQFRMVRLAGAASRECVADLPGLEGIPLFLALPETLPGQREAVNANIMRQLSLQSGLVFNEKRSRVFAQGRAAGMAALCEALRWLDSGVESYILVGGVDTYVDLELLERLDREERIKSTGVYDGFIPGEGAAFLLLGTAGAARRLKRERLGLISVAALGEEQGHRYSEKSYRGEGLATAFQQLFSSRAQPGEPIRTVFAGLNGENLNAKEWGVAFLRHRRYFAENFRVEHPVDCLGDPGAALGPLMLGLAVRGIRRRYLQPPCLVWCSSDLALRGAALVSGAGE